jgi:hypothetical protein
MSAKRYFQLAFVWPGVLPVLILALPGWFVAQWVERLSRELLYTAEVPYLLFAALMLFWSCDKEAASVRRSTYLAPLLFLPVLALTMVIAGLRATGYRSDSAGFLLFVLVYGFILIVPVLSLGYAYVGVINLAFVILRSSGVFPKDPIQAPGALPKAWEWRDAGTSQLESDKVHSYGSVKQSGRWAASSYLPGSTYGFAGWEEEKVRGGSRSSPEIAIQSSCASSPGEAAQSREAGAQGTACRGAGDPPARFIPRPEPSGQRPSSEYTTKARSDGASVNPIPIASASPGTGLRPDKKARSTRARLEWDPLRAASLAMFVPLIMLTAFAICRHKSVLHNQAAAIHRTGDVVGYGAGSEAKNGH